MEIDIGPDDVIREYRFERAIGSGAYGMVWRAYHEFMDVPFAIKVVDVRDLDPESVERIKRECHIGGQLAQQEHIVKVRDAFQEEGHLFIVMELMDGGSLAGYLRECGCPDLGLSLRWALNLCTALEEVHELGVIHRDIKPQNILLTNDGQVKLSDFGVAHLPESTLTSYQPGTPAYQAPEQAANQPVDRRTDVYALCAVLFEVWGGRKYVRFRDQDREIAREELTYRLDERYHLSPGLRDRLAGAVLAGLRPRAARDSLTKLRANLSSVYDDWRAETKRKTGSPVGIGIGQERYMKRLADAYRAFFRDRFVHQAMDAVERPATLEPDAGSSAEPPSDPLMVEFMALMDEEEEGETQVPGEIDEVETRPVADLHVGLSEYEAIALLGAPGAGKTSALLWLLGTWQEAEQGVDHLPVFVSLSRYDQDSFEDFLAEAWAPSLVDALRADEEHQKALERAIRPLAPRLGEYLSEGRAVLLLDALNELPRGSTRPERLDRLRYFVQETAEMGNWVVVSCRQRDYDEALQPLQRVEIRPLDDVRIRGFLKAYLGPQRGDELWSTLGEPHYARLRELIRNPFLLAGLTSIRRREGGALPTVRADLLNRLAALSIGWEGQKGHPGWIPKEEQEKVLGALALAMTALGKTIVNKAELVDRLPDVWFFEPGRQEPLLDTVLRLAQGARLARWTPGENGGTVTFEHQVWQEYYAARLLAGMHDPEWRGLVRYASGRDKAVTPYDVLRPHLPDSLWHGVARMVAEALEQIGREDEAAEILGGLASNAEVEVEVRFEAVEALNQLGCVDEVTRILVGLAQDGTLRPTARRAAGKMLERIGRMDAAADVLLELARDASMPPGFRRVTAETVGQMGWVDEAAKVLRTLMRNAEISSWEPLMVAEALGGLGFVDEATQTLLALARDVEIKPQERRRAAKALGQLGRVDEAADVLLELVQDTTMPPGFRRKTAEVLGKLGRAAAEALGRLGRADEAPEIFLALARSEKVNPRDRRRTAEALGQLGRVDEATEVLLALARNTEVSPQERRMAAEALEYLDRVNEATEVLLALTRNTEVRPQERRGAAEALEYLSRVDEAPEIFLALARSEDVSPRERRMAAEALGQLGRVDEATEVLLALARNTEVSPQERRMAAEALGQLDCVDEATEILLALAQDAEVKPPQRRLAAEALGRLGRVDEAAEVLLALARNTEVRPQERRGAAEALEYLSRVDEATEIFLALARSEDVSPRERRMAAEALGQLGHKDLAADILVAGAEDPSAETALRWAMVWGLKRLGYSVEAGRIQPVRVGEMVRGTVKDVSPKMVMLNIEGIEAILPRSQQLPGESYHCGKRLWAYVLEVRRTQRGTRIGLSRSHPGMLRRLLELNVPEICNGTVEVKGIAREAGSRSKVAVVARQSGVDPVGACVGRRGARIKSIVDKLGGEKIDLIEWSSDPAVFIANALSPAKVLSVQLGEDEGGRRSASVVVSSDQMSLAIGRAGQNVRLAAKLCGYRIDIQA